MNATVRRLRRPGHLRRPNALEARRGLPSGRIVVVSPHLDDGVFSVGGLISALTRTGAEVIVLTVFAGDPESSAPPGWWDGRVGFRTAGAAARARREEDRRACALVGATPVWLPFVDCQYTQDNSAVLDAMAPFLSRADGLLVPGFPLENPDHHWLHEQLLERLAELPPVSLYCEQPYAEQVWFMESRLPSSPAGDPLSMVRWVSFRPPPIDWWRKQRAFRAYDSQLRGMSRPKGRVPLRIALYELRLGGEVLGLLNERTGKVSLAASERLQHS